MSADNILERNGWTQCACGMGLQVSESALGAAVRDAFLAQHEGHSPAPQETPKETQR